jgi:hypothetical protein
MRQQKSNNKSGTQPSGAKSSASGATDAISLLKADHQKVDGLFSKCESAEGEQQSQIVHQICQELIIHAKVEEEIFYPACREHDVESDTMDEAQVEHDSLKVMIGDLLDASPEDQYYEAKVSVLKEYVKHHVNEEEMPRTGMFAQAKKAGLDLEELGAKIKSRKEELQGEGESLMSEPLEAPSLQLHHLQPSGGAGMSQSGSSQRWQQDDGRYARGQSSQNRSGQQGWGQGGGDRYSTSGSSSRYGQQSGQGQRERDNFGRFGNDEEEQDRYSRGGRYQGNQNPSREGRYGSGNYGQRSESERGYSGSQSDRDYGGSSGYGGSSRSPYGSQGTSSSRRGQNRSSEDRWQDDNNYGQSSRNRFSGSSQYDEDEDSDQYSNWRGASSSSRGRSDRD